jgi:hypothetical protein
LLNRDSSAEEDILEKSKKAFFRKWKLWTQCEAWVFSCRDLCSWCWRLY